jgi:hypothetical protein
MRVTEPEIDRQLINSGWITAIAVLMVVLGIIAISFPLFATIASTLVFGWLFIFAGIAQIVYAFHSRGAGQILAIPLGRSYHHAPGYKPDRTSDLALRPRDRMFRNRIGGVGRNSDNLDP